MITIHLFRSRLPLSAAALIAIYQFLFTYIYIDWASPSFWYLGLTHYSSDLFTFTCSLIFLFLAAFVLTTRVYRFSDFVCWILYLTILTPALIIIPLQDPTTQSALYLTTSLFVSFLLIVLIPRYVVMRESVGVRQISPRQFFAFFMLVYISLVAIMVSSYGSVMSLAGIKDIYIQRSIAAGSGASALSAYATNWLLNAFNPFLITVGLFDKTRRWCLALGIVGQILVYSVFAGKVALVGVLVMLGFFYFCIGKNVISIKKLLMIVVGLMVFVLLCRFLLLVLQLPNDSLPGLLMSVIYMRTFSLPAAFNGVYASFFEHSQWTYYTHINFIGVLFDYPYSEALGNVIGRDIMSNLGSDGVFNANANFWATDGTAALGNFGVMVMGCIVGLALAFANKFGSVNKLFFVTTLSIPYLMSLTNGGFFTSLLTGGGLILIFLVGYGIPTASNSFKRRPQYAAERINL